MELQLQGSNFRMSVDEMEVHREAACDHAPIGQREGVGVSARHVCLVEFAVLHQLRASLVLVQEEPAPRCRIVCQRSVRKTSTTLPDGVCSWCRKDELP